MHVESRVHARRIPGSCPTRPGFTLPGDISASDRFYRTDITAPLTITDGYMDVPTGPGLGVTPIPEILDSVTTATEWIAL